MNTLKVSIIVPCYNQAQYLDEALQSVLEQTYIHWECVVVNDGSSDHTEEVAKKWIEKDNRFHYFKKENGGLCKARNYGISNAKGIYILPLDADDKISPDYIYLAVKSFQEDTSLKVVYCKAEKFDFSTGIWKLPTFSLYNLSLTNMIFCSALYKKSDWKSVGGYDENMKYGWEDWEFWIAILKNGGNVKCLDEVGFFYRMRMDSMIKKINTQKKKYLLNYMSVKHVDFFVEHLGSFIEMNESIEKTKSDINLNLKGRKFVIDVFCSTFFGFSVFGLYKK